MRTCLAKELCPVLGVEYKLCGCGSVRARIFDCVHWQSYQTQFLYNTSAFLIDARSRCQSSLPCIKASRKLHDYFPHLSFKGGLHWTLLDAFDVDLFIVCRVLCAHWNFYINLNGSLIAVSTLLQFSVCVTESESLVWLSQCDLL